MPATKKNRKTMKVQIIEALEQGESTHRIIAEKLGLVPNDVSSYLCALRKLGLVRVKGHKKQPGRATTNVWELVA